MSKKRKVRKSKEIKFKVALEAIKGSKTVPQIAKEYNVHPEQITQWKSELLDNGSNLFNSKSEKNSSVDQKEVDSLYKTIGQQTTELNFLKKNLGMSTDWKD